MTQTKSIFQRSLWVTIFALTAAIAWGWAYPLIKLGFAEFGMSFRTHRLSNSRR